MENLLPGPWGLPFFSFAVGTVDFGHKEKSTEQVEEQLVLQEKKLAPVRMLLFLCTCVSFHYRKQIYAYKY